MALLWVWLLCGLLCCVSVRGTADQLEIPEFFYHNRTSLLLATTSSNCYFIHIDNATSPQMEHDDYRLELEHRLLTAIWDNAGVSDTTLEAVRNMFEDRLADFHCLDKNIYLLALPVEPPTTATTTTQPTHHTTHPTTHPTHAPHATHPTMYSTAQPTHPLTHATHAPTHALNATHPPTHALNATHPPTHPTLAPHATHPPTHALNATHPPTHPIGPQPASTELALHDCNDPRYPYRFQLMADVAFLLDVSTSVTNEEFIHVKELLKAMTSHYQFGNHDVQLSVTEYDRFPHLIFDFNTFQHPDQVKQAVDHLREVQSAHHTDQTVTGAALHFIRDQVFTAAAGDRPEAPNVLVVISDGSNIANQNHQELVQQAQLLHNDGVQIIVIGIGDSIQGHLRELAQIANHDVLSSVHLFDYNQLHGHPIADHINTVICTEVYAHTSG